MARDYKNTGRGRRKNGVPGWAWLLTGLAIGLFVAFGVYLAENVPPERAAMRLPDVSPGSASSENEQTSDAQGEDSSGSGGPPQPRFDFYTILPEREVVVPESELDDGSSGERPSSEAAPAAPGTRYVLQAGSFKHYKEADKLKASLALVGIQADIHTVTINGGETWHRVRIGPYGDRARLRSIHNRLRQHDIEAILLKVKG